jgi:Tfp pilus assembly protein PilX
MMNILQKRNNGYTLLFAVLVTSIVLSVSISILSISRKEFVLSTSARESQFAFYAADSGLECASYYDFMAPQFNSTTTAAVIQCGAMAATIDVTPTTVTDGNSSTSTFAFSFPISSAVAGSACSNVSVKKASTYIPSGGPGVPAKTTTDTVVVASGYNAGWNPSGSPVANCSFASPKKVERELKLHTRK